MRGTKLLVPWAASADIVLVTTGDGIHVVDRERVSGELVTTRHDDLGADPLYVVSLENAPAERLGDGEDQSTIVRSALDHASIAQLAYVVGVADRALELAVEHATDRHQFGRPIGSFQAVAHRCVDMRTELDACRYLTYQAAWALDLDRAADLEVGAALAYAKEAMRRIFTHAHQVHGALGFSTEHDLHLLTRRAKAFELSYGAPTRHLERVAVEIGLGLGRV